MNLRIDNILNEKGKTIKWLSDELGITYANTNNIVNNKAKPSLERLEKIATALDVPITELFEVQSTDNSMHCPNCGAKLKLDKAE